MSLRQSPDNRFLTAPVGRVFLFTAFPMIVIMGMNGMLGIIDAMFLGHFVGAEAMTAIGIAFPVLMLTIAISSMVSGGMSSLLARQLGAGVSEAAGATFASAHGLALLSGATLILVFLAGGRSFATGIAGPDGPVAGMVWVFLAISLLGTPVQFLLGIHADAWRNQGKAGLMALMSLGVTLLNIAMNYILIVLLDLGIAGSALGTLAAQAAGLALLVGLRGRIAGMLPLASLRHHSWTRGWGRIVALGAPVSLSFIGIALSAVCVVVALRLGSSGNSAQTIAAYGIATRIFGFAFLPIMAVALAMQSIVGNNVGARLYDRSDRVLAIAAATALGYCLVVELLLLSEGVRIGSAFVTDAGVINEVARLFRPMTAAYCVSGPIFMLGLYFQAIGRPVPAALLTMAKPLILLPVLVATVAAIWGSDAIWYAYPLAEGLTAVIALLLLARTLKARQGSAGVGLQEMENLT